MEAQAGEMQGIVLGLVGGNRSHTSFGGKSCNYLSAVQEASGIPCTALCFRFSALAALFTRCTPALHPTAKEKGLHHAARSCRQREDG